MCRICHLKALNTLISDETILCIHSIRNFRTNSNSCIEDLISIKRLQCFDKYLEILSVGLGRAS